MHRQSPSYEKAKCRGETKCANCHGEHVSCSTECPHIQPKLLSRAQERHENIINGTTNTTAIIPKQSTQKPMPQ
eukprot:Pgem_evm1s7690